ncbi:hypothetical protein CL6EHI_109260 [Entamoeba histolytica]|uniref:Uncharacterized protein n=2 Tax=Entamoeba histolytica TaxID=5759 RepID=B1N447_ENTH1|nr:hypothetical protein EHI_109260 [Entamoeba histolytica HM-1:IMSS]EDS89262.1 hypothetical protein EHI_109260 [Entamoeba histolytica HM-1:IMSS]GAT97549.1 hypothetical protein CL6EHI_109260 [Entamoeba histolytica]|eukprot:XP_001913963.1 hypothetical protein EHI_109260 [Entamoeba histolytica HM-1:IMSS]
MFTSEKDVNQFCRIFNPPTCNCNLLPVDESILMKVENIRNYNFDSFVFSTTGNDTNKIFGQQQTSITKEDRERMSKIIQKVESLIYFSYASDEIIEIIIQNMKKGIKIRSNEMVSKVFNETFDKMKIEESLYPSEMITYVSNNVNGIKARENKNIILIYEREIPIKQEKEIDIPKGITIYSSSIVLSEQNNERNIKFFKSPSNSITCYKTLLPDFVLNQKIKLHEIPQLPEYIKYLYVQTRDSNIIINQQYIECLEMNYINSSIEFLSVNNLKQIKLHGKGIKVNEMKEKQGITTNKRRYWKEIQENITTFQNLEEIQLISCCNLHINLVANKLKNIDMNNCVESQISVKTESIERMKLEDNKQTQFKLTTNKSSDICIEKCENFKIEIEANNEQNIDIIEGNNIEFKTKCPINKLTIIESKEVSIKGNEKCKSLKVVESTINENDVKPKRIVFKSIEEYIKIPLKEAEEIYIVSMKDYIFEELFDKCKKLYIDECENCQIIIKKNENNEMKITRCKNTEITGKLDNLEEITTIDNEECSIPETKKNIKEDREIIDMNNEKKDIEIETDKKHVIIRNGYDSRIKIQSDINSDITIENSEDIIIEGEYEEYGNIKMVKCKNHKEKQDIGYETYTKIGCVRSLLLNKCENIEFEIYGDKKSLEVVDSKMVGILIRRSFHNTGVDIVRIENSEMSNISSSELCNKVFITNSSGIKGIISQCKEELVLKRMNDIRFRRQRKKANN